MRNILLLISAGVLALPACRPERAPPVKTPEVGEAFPALIVPPGGELVSRQGSADALQFTFRTAQPVADVAEFYRRMLGQPGWRIVSDMADPTGAIAIFAEGEKRPLWIRIAADSTGTLVDLTGAVSGLDSTYARKRREAFDTTNTVRPR